jgi:hypothetical protein
MIEPLHPGFAVSKATTHFTSLRSMINHLLRHPLSELMRGSNSSVMNEIPSELCTVVDESRILPVMNDLLTIVISNARRGRIHIRAEKFHDIIVLEIHDQSCYNSYALDYSIKSVKQSARLIGGTVSIKGQPESEITVSFSFPDKAVHLRFDC